MSMYAPREPPSRIDADDQAEAKDDADWGCDIHEWRHSLPIR